jgi:hypothetical protein
MLEMRSCFIIVGFLFLQSLCAPPFFLSHPQGLYFMRTLRLGLLQILNSKSTCCLALQVSNC